MVFISNAEVIQGNLIQYLTDELEERKTPGPEPHRPASVESFEVNRDLDMVTVTCLDGSSMVILIKTAFDLMQYTGQKQEVS